MNKIEFKTKPNGIIRPFVVNIYDKGPTYHRWPKPIEVWILFSDTIIVRDKVGFYGSENGPEEGKIAGSHAPDNCYEKIVCASVPEAYEIVRQWWTQTNE